MDQTEMLDLLVTDLKMTLDVDISTAEGIRAIQRAVDELGRSVPRERIYEYTWIEAVTDDSFTTPAATSAAYLVSAMDLPNTVVDGSKATLTATVWLDVPRPVTFTLTDGDDSITRMTLIVRGTDADGVHREERFYRFNGKTQIGKIYFSYIQEIEFGEILGNVTGDLLSMGTAAPDTAGSEVWIQLDNPIEHGSESIYSGALQTGTKYTLDTDYHMDYANGRICFTNAGSMAAATTYYANYKRASTSIDISSIIPELFRIGKVLYPSDKIPEQQVSFSIWENMLTIGSLRQGVSQTSLTDGEHIAIYYEARQTPPTLVSSGSYPEFLDEVVLQGAGGFALLMEALELELQSVTDLAELRTTLSYLGIGGVGAAALTLVYKSIDDALDKVALYLETNGTTDNATDRLAEITDMEAHLRDMIIKLADGTGAIADGNAYLDKVAATDIDIAAVGATAWLLEGELLINRLNDGGPDVPEKFADYARAKLQIAQTRTQAAVGFFQEATVRLDMLRSYIEESGAWMRMGEDFIAEAQSRIAEANVYLTEAARYQEVAGLDLLLADRLRAEAQVRLTEFRTMLSSRSEYRRRVVSTSVRQPA